MAEFIRTEEKVVNVGEPVIFENNTDSDFSVSAAIVFRKSGLYDVSIVGRRTIISKVAERKKGYWEMLQIPINPPVYKCSVCGNHALQTVTGSLMNRHLEANLTDFCPNCGADMRGENNGSD